MIAFIVDWCRIFKSIAISWKLTNYSKKWVSRAIGLQIANLSNSMVWYRELSAPRMSLLTILMAKCWAREDRMETIWSTSKKWMQTRLMWLGQNRCWCIRDSLLLICSTNKNATVTIRGTSSKTPSTWFPSTNLSSNNFLYPSRTAFNTCQPTKV